MSVPCTVCVTTGAPFWEAYFLLLCNLYIVYCGTVEPWTYSDKLLPMQISHLLLPAHKQCISWFSLVKENLIFWWLLMVNFIQKVKIIMPASNTSNHSLVRRILKQQRNAASIAEVLCLIHNSKCGLSWAAAWSAPLVRLKCSQDTLCTSSCDVIR